MTLREATRTIALVNPNTTVSVTELMRRCAGAVVGPGTTVVPITNTTGAASIESHYDEARALPGLLAAVEQGERDGVDGRTVDGWVIGCFGDPGLDACRELASGPVLGIAEAGMHAAAMVGRTFSIVTTLGRTMGRASELVQRYGFAHHCRSIYACEVPVLELDDPESDARKLVIDYCRRAVEYDEADSVVLGCAGMADFCADVSAEIGVPVVDGVTAGVAMVEALLRVGLRTSSRSEYAPLPPKTYR